MEKLSITDGLTQAFNWRYAEQALMELFLLSTESGTPLTLAMFDLDDFKKINDRYGHAKGDEVLRLLADYIRSLLRESDIFIRMGGDEFLIIFPNTELSDGIKGFERLRAALAAYQFPGVDLRLTLSGGITTRLPGDRPANALQRVDRMLYQVKDSGKNKILSD